MKRILNFTIIAVLILLVYFSFNIDRNINMRYWLRSHFQSENVTTSQAGTYFLGQENIYWDEEMPIDKGYIVLSWLSELDITYLFDEENGILSVIGNGNFLSFDLEGNLDVNQEKVSDKGNFIYKNQQIFIPIEIANKYLDLKLKVNYSPDNEQCIITSEWIQYQASEIAEPGYLFENVSQFKAVEGLIGIPTVSSLFKPIDMIDFLPKEESVIAYYTNAETVMLYNHNFVGYASAAGVKDLKLKHELLKKKTDFYPKDYLSNEKIFLIWEAVYSKNPNTDTISDMPGVNVLSPTWIELKDSTGDVTENISSGYINWNRANNRATWILATNGFDAALTHEFLYRTSSRKNFIEKIIALALANKLDGINLDFENISIEDTDALTHFVNELAWYCNQVDLTLSMDVTVMGGSDNWSKSFDREMLGRIVDYLIIMTYDEFWASSPTSGLVASLDWVENSLIQICEIVPSRKVIMGIPFYTRIWQEKLSADQSNAVEVSSKSIGIIAQNELIDEKNLPLIWNDQDGLYYTSYIEDDVVNKIWVENSETIALKAALVKKLNLKGIACWRRGLEPTDIYEILRKELN